jgi:hypothetical protein
MSRRASSAKSRTNHSRRQDEFSDDERYGNGRKGRGLPVGYSYPWKEDERLVRAQLKQISKGRYARQINDDFARGLKNVQVEKPHDFRSWRRIVNGRDQPITDEELMLGTIESRLETLGDVQKADHIMKIERKGFRQAEIAAHRGKGPFPVRQERKETLPLPQHLRGSWPINKEGDALRQAENEEVQHIRNLIKDLRTLDDGKEELYRKELNSGRPPKLPELEVEQALKLVRFRIEALRRPDARLMREFQAAQEIAQLRERVQWLENDLKPGGLLARQERLAIAKGEDPRLIKRHGLGRGGQQSGLTYDPQVAIRLCEDILRAVTTRILTPQEYNDINARLTFKLKDPRYNVITSPPLTRLPPPELEPGHRPVLGGRGVIVPERRLPRPIAMVKNAKTDTQRQCHVFLPAYGLARKFQHDVFVEGRSLVCVPRGSDRPSRSRTNSRR